MSRTSIAGPRAAAGQASTAAIPIADANVDPGWFEFPAPQGLGWGFGGSAHGLVADPRDSDRVLYTNEAAVYFADRGTTAALPAGPPNPKNWTQRFTRLASGAAGQASDRWQTTGLDVTTVWNYVIHPTNPAVHMLCCTDVGLQRSDDTGLTWHSIAFSDIGSPNQAEWQNFYELAYDAPFTTFWAAVSDQHDIPQDTQLNKTPGKGAVLSSSDGVSWKALPAPWPGPGPAPGPVVSVLHDDVNVLLYAAVWGAGVYVLDLKLASPSWAPVGSSGLPPNPFCHQLRKVPGGSLYCAVAADRRGVVKPNPGGLYELTGNQWLNVTTNNPVSPPGTLAPMDFDFHPGSGAVYLATASVTGGQGGGGLYKSTGGSGTATTWTAVPVSQPPPPWAQPYPTYFKPHFDEGFIYVSSITHGIRFSADDGINWQDYPALPFQATQRILPTFQPGASDASFLITTLGGSAWRAPRLAYFVDNRSAFSRYDVDAAPVDAGATTKTFPEALYVVFDGFLPAELGITAANPFPTLMLTNQRTGQPPARFALVTPRFLPEDPSLPPDRIQRFTVAYDVRFSADVNGSYLADFGPANQDNFIEIKASKGFISTSTSIKLFYSPHPYMVDGPVPWLSDDLRVFQVRDGVVPPAGVPPSPGTTTFSGTTVADALAYLNTVLATYNTPSNTTYNFDDIDPGYGSALTLQTSVGGKAAFNFALARVRYASASAAPPGAPQLRVFFRSFRTQSTSLVYTDALGQTGIYRRGPNSASDEIALLGATPAGEVVGLPYYDQSRIDTVGQPLTAQPEPTALALQIDPVPTLHLQYFGCLLDFNQADNRFPTQVTGMPIDGPYGASATSLQNLIRGLHQCLVAELNYAPNPIPAGATTASSDSLSQRNLSISESANPGSPDSRTVHHTFEIRQSRLRSRQREGGGEPPTQWGAPDELLIRWLELPPGTEATLFLDRADAGSILRLAARRPGNGLSETGPNTLRLRVDDVSWVPLPQTTRTIPALLTLKLPAGVRAGQRFRAVVHQVSGQTRAIVGSFELAIPVQPAEQIVPLEEDRLAVLRFIARSVAANDPWRPVFERYVAQTAARARAFGGDPEAILPSPNGASQRRGCLGWLLWPRKLLRRRLL